MGIVKRQGIQVGFLSYIGAALGYIIKVSLFTTILSKDQVGLANLLFTIATIYASISAFGTGSITFRFFPFFKDNKNHHNGFFFWSSIISLSGFILFTILFLLLNQSIKCFYSNEPLLIDYYYYIIPFGFFLLIYNFLDNYLRAQFKSVFSTFVNEIILRLLIIASLVAFYTQIISFEQFVSFYILSHSVPALLLIIYGVKIGEINIKPSYSMKIKRLKKNIAVYGFYSYIGSISYIILGNLSILIVSKLLGLEFTGIYATMYNLTIILLVPHRALGRVSSPIVTEAWKRKDFNKLYEIYRKVSITNLISGIFILLLLWVNFDNLLHFMRADYSIGKITFLILGLAQLVEMYTGLNGFILVTSKKYKYDAIFTAFLIVITVISNYLLIPVLSIEGAALATLLTVITFNLVRVFSVYYLFKLQPFLWKDLIVIVLGIIAVGVSMLICPMFNVFVDIFLRSLICSVIFLLPVYFLRISEDISQTIDNVICKVLKR